MREYKMRRGEYIDERVPDLEGLIEDYFGPVTGTETYNGSKLNAVDDPTNPAFARVIAGAVEYDSKKDTLAVHFEERDPQELIETGDVERAQEAVDLKNDFLEEVTGRDAEARRDSMKRAVEDDPDNDFEA